jgi:hypothetical protein
MIVSHNIDSRNAIQEAFQNMLAEEAAPEQVKNIVRDLKAFIKKNHDAFESGEELKNANRLVKVIQKSNDEINIINLIADFSNLVTNSEKYSKEFEKILGYIG